MFLIFSSLAIILTNSVIAQAAEPSIASGVVRFDTKGWVTTHTGELEVDGLLVNATLEIFETSVNSPRLIAGMAGTPDGMTMMNLGASMPKRSFRLTFSAAHNSNVNAEYELKQRTISLDGNFRTAYISAADEESGFQFVVTTEEDGSMKVSYNRRILDATFIDGSFVMSPVFTTNL